MKRILLNISLVFIILFNSCIDDNITPPLTGDLNAVGEMLVYFESKGEYPNTLLAPALVDAAEVFANLGNYFLIDLRDSSEFIAGHIQGAVKVSADSLYDFIKSIQTNSYPKIILISSDGQSSAYFASLLRLAGNSNIYTMNYGMASWNPVFASVWYNAIGDHPDLTSFTDETYPKYDFSALPEIAFDNPEGSVESRIEERVRKVVEAGFKSVPTLPSAFNNYIICYASDKVYFAGRNFGELGHVAGTVSYLNSPFFEFRSVNYLQTLPTNKKIYIYDYNGQLSACMSAYLRVLGYDAYSILYGYNQLYYSRMIQISELLAYAFTSSVVNDFAYVMGD